MPQFYSPSPNVPRRLMEKLQECSRMYITPYIKAWEGPKPLPPLTLFRSA